MEGVDEFTSVIDSITQLNEEMNKIAEEIKPFLKMDLKSDIIKLSPLEASSFHVVLGQAITTCFEIYLKCKGALKEDHPLMKEIKRIEQYLTKVHEAIYGKEKNPIQIDKEAAKRIIVRTVNMNEYFANRSKIDKSSS